MEITYWTAQTKPSESHDKLDRRRHPVSFFVDATLECPFCKATISVETPALRLVQYDREAGILTKPEHYAYSAVVALSAKRACQQCGIVSQAPATNRQVVEDDLVSIVTEDWICNRLAQD